MKKTFIILFVVSLSTILKAQVRPDVNSFSPVQRTQLADLMEEYITLEVIQRHCDYSAQAGSTTLDIHDDFNFLPFHRTYIEDMEDFMLLKGHPEFVPLPKWDQSTCLPTELRRIDVICNTLGTNNCGNSGFNCSTPNWCPSNPFPSNLSTTIQSGTNNDICDYSFSPTSPGGSNSNGLSARIEGPYHNNGHTRMGGAMGTFTSPVVLAFWLWHAHIDDVWKSWEQNCPQTTTLPVDLYMKDREFIIQEQRDRGEEPNIDNGPMWLSKDIWVRNQPDGFTTDENEKEITVSPNAPLYVYVRVRNRGFQNSLGSEQIELRWAKAATSLAWPNNWNGSVDLDPDPNITALAGNVIDIQQISAPIKAGGHQIIEFIWNNPPNPSDYANINTEIGHFCLLARVVASNDPMASTETGDLNGNVRNNNNIVWKNIDIIDNIPGIVAGGGCAEDVMQSVGNAVIVGNPLTVNETFNLTFKVPQEELPVQLSGMIHDHDFEGNHFMRDASTLTLPDKGIPVTEEGMVLVALTDGLYNKWVQGGKIAEGVTEINPHTTLLGNLIGATPLHDILFDPHRKLFQVTNINATFKNIPLSVGENHSVSTMVLYPTSPESVKEKFTFDVIQTLTSTGNNVGGVRYDIRKPNCTTKFVDAGVDRVIKRGCNTTLSASQQFPCAAYRWTDNNGNVISRSSEVSVTPLTSTEYTLYTVSNEGCASTDKINVTVNNQLCLPINFPSCLTDIVLYPNPSTESTMQVQLTAEQAATVKLEVRHAVFGNLLKTVTAPVVEGINTVPVDISTLQAGSYQIRISCTGQNGLPYVELFTKM